MEVQVKDEAGNVVWSKGAVGGMTSKSYGTDGTLQQIEQVLAQALAQCRGELAIAMNPDRVGQAG